MSKARESRRPRQRLPWGATVAAAWLVLVGLGCIVLPWFLPHAPNVQDVTNKFAAWSWSHPLGTDLLGRDTLTRLLHGGRTSLGIALATTVVALLIALPVGLYAGYKGRFVDQAVMRLVDAFLGIPPLVAVIAIAVVIGPGAITTVIALVAASVWPMIRFIRNEALSNRSELFVEAAQVSRVATARILLRHILPQVLPALLVAASFWFAAALLAEAGLSFVGAGVQPPKASWGSMLRQGVDSSLFTDASQFLMPGVAIASVVLAANTLGEGIRSSLGWAVTPKRRRGDRIGITSVSAPARPRALADDVATGAETDQALLSVRGLTVEVARAPGAAVEILRDVDLEIRRGEIVGVVGESGSGKTVTALSITRLLPSPPMRITSGSVTWKGRDLLSLPVSELRRVRGAEIAVVFQDPLSSLDPNFTIGDQLISAYRVHHRREGRKAARRRAIDLLDRVQISGGARRLDDYPHQLSGGMRQRAMIAMGLICDPDLLIADESTTALDVTVQAGIIDLLRDVQRDTQMAMMVVTHDLGVVEDMCDRVAVMYAGQIVEENDADTFFGSPSHPYSAGLLRSNPRLDGGQDRLRVLPGLVPPLGAMPRGCRFAPRCDFAVPECSEADLIEFVDIGSRSGARCIRIAEVTARVGAA